MKKSWYKDSYGPKVWVEAVGFVLMVLFITGGLLILGYKVDQEDCRAFRVSSHIETNFKDGRCFVHVDSNTWVPLDNFKMTKEIQNG